MPTRIENQNFATSGRQANVEEHQFELSVGCKNIQGVGHSRSDPFCALFVASPRGRWHFLGRTEAIYGDSNAMWTQKFLLDRVWGARPFRFEVYDRNSAHKGDKQYQLIGYAQGVVLKGMSKLSSNISELPLIRKGREKPCGSLSFDVDVIKRPVQRYRITFFVQIMFARRIKPYFQISRLLNVQDRTVSVYRSELLDTRACRFVPVSIDTANLCGGDPDRRVRFEVFQFRPRKHDSMLGYFETSLNELMKLSKQDTLHWQSSKRRIERWQVRINSTPLVHMGNASYSLSIVRQ